MTPLGKFLRVRSGLRLGNRIDYPPLSPWVEREGRRKARERMEARAWNVVAFGGICVVVAAFLWVAMSVVDRMLP